MASDAPPPADSAVKVRKRRQKRESENRRKEVQEVHEGQEVREVNIEELTAAGHRALQEGRSHDALRCFSKAVKAAGQLQDSHVLRACSFNLGAAYVEAGQPLSGLDYLHRAQPGPRAEQLPDLQFNLALAHNALGQGQEAARCFLQAAQLYRSQGDGSSEGDACMEMSRCYSRSQDCSLAAQGFLRAADSYKLATRLDSAASALSEAGSHMIQSEGFSHDDITCVLAECLSLTEKIGEPGILGELYLSMGMSYSRLRCFQEALQCFQLAVKPASHQPPLLATVLHNLGAALNAAGQFKAAVDAHRLAARLYGSQGRRGEQARCFSNLGMAFSQLGEEEEAAESFVLALQGFRDIEEHLAQVQVCQSLAQCYLRLRKCRKAVELYKEALVALSHCQDPPEGVQDRLVEGLTSALQADAGIGMERPPQQRRRPLPRPHPHSPPVSRFSELTQDPGRLSNQRTGGQPIKGQRAGPGEAPTVCGTGPEVTGVLEADLDCDREEPKPSSSSSSSRRRRSGSLSSNQAEQQAASKPHPESLEAPPTDSLYPLVKMEEAPPTALTQAPPLLARLRSRLCSLM